MYGEEDLYGKFASLVPSFAARCHLFCEYSFTPEINNKMKQTKATWVYRNHPFTPQKKNTPSQLFHINEEDLSNQDR